LKAANADHFPDSSSQPITPHGAMFTAGAVVASSSAGTGRDSLDYRGVPRIEYLGGSSSGSVA
jgi:hypothetical protein